MTEESRSISENVAWGKRTKCELGKVYLPYKQFLGYEKGPDGQPMSYSLDHKEGGRRLLEAMTLVEAGVQNGDHLIIYPEVVAGA